MSEGDLQRLFPGSLPLVFTGYRGKRYAKTPGGEFAYSDVQGLYEWRHVDVDGTSRLVRVQHAGGDRQVSSGGQMWRHDPVAPGRRELPCPDELGFRAALDPVRLS